MQGLPTPELITATFPSLTRREAELCSLVALRLTTLEMASRLSIGPRTVEKHLENVFAKLGVQSREQLRLRLGVLPPRGSARA